MAADEPDAAGALDDNGVRRQACAWWYFDIDDDRGGRFNSKYLLYFRRWLIVCRVDDMPQIELIYAVFFDKVVIFAELLFGPNFIVYCMALITTHKNAFRSVKLLINALGGESYP